MAAGVEETRPVARKRREDEPGTEARGTADAPTAAPAPGLSSPAAVLALQRASGNHAVAAMLARQPDGADGGTATLDAGPASAGPADAGPVAGVRDFFSAVADGFWAEALKQLEGLPDDALKAKLEAMQLPMLESIRDRATDPRVKAAAEAARIVVLHREYAAAVGSNWDRAALLLNAFNDADITTKLKALSEDQLRLLDDGAQRAMPGFDTRVRTAISAALKGLGISEARAKAGQRYGTVTFKVGTIVDGAKDPAKNFEYPFEVWFEPDAALVDADEIAWIQTVRNVSSWGDNKSPYGKKRMTDDHTKVDRLQGKEQGWYGMNDDQTAAGNLKIWKKGGTEKAAYLYDAPSFPDGDRDFHFESAAVAKSGPDEGKVYATVTWGFKVDADLKVTAKDTKIFNKETVTLDKAVEMWNKQADMTDAADKNAAGQKKLPTLK